MKTDGLSPTAPRERPGRRLAALERVTAAVLILVLACLAWLVAVSRWPEWGRLFPVEVEAALVLTLLAAALLLVSAVALLQTR